VARAVYAPFVLLASAFVVSSTVQIAQSVFAEGDLDARAGAPALSTACASAVRELTAAVDRGIADASSARDHAEAARKYRAARGPAPDAPERRELVRPCQNERQGEDALAAVSRLDRAAEGAVTAAASKIAELGPVRRAVDSFIR